MTPTHGGISQECQKATKYTRLVLFAYGLPVLIFTFFCLGFISPRLANRNREIVGPSYTGRLVKTREWPNTHAGVDPEEVGGYWAEGDPAGTAARRRGVRSCGEF
jgi:hypothetical protein